MTPTENDRHTYSYGLCHAHALAAVGLHGGSLLVFTDPNETVWEYEDGDEVHAVIHVMSVHETPAGRIARDVHGDVPFDSALQIVTDRYEIDDLQVEEMTHAWELDALIDTEDDGSRPLCALDPADITTAAELSTVKDPPAMKLVSTDSNTRISYTYRTPDGFAAAHDVVMPGRLQDGDLARLQAALAANAVSLRAGDLGAFIPGQVGLPDLQDSAQAASGSPFHVVDAVAVTDTPADPDAPTFVAFLAQLEAVWRDEGYTAAAPAEMSVAGVDDVLDVPEVDTFDM